MADRTVEIDNDFFQRVCDAGQVERACGEWNRWLQQRPGASEKAKYIRALVIAGGVSESSIRHYLHPANYRKLGETTLATLDRITQALGRELPRRDRRASRLRRSGRRVSSIALVTQVSTIPSAAFHLRLFDGIAREAAVKHLLLSIHPVQGADATPVVETAVREYQAKGVIMLRLTPTRRVLEVLRGTDTPAVLVHADRQQYEAPILTNVVPDHSKIEALRSWLLGRPHIAAHRDRPPRVVVAAMPDEKLEIADFPEIPGVPRSIRNDRKRRVLAALEGFELAREDELDDYDFRHALRVWERNRDADAFICLSDPIAVGVKQLMVASGKRQDWRHRIVGFDDSALSKAENIASFSQDLDRVGALAVQALDEFFAAPDYDRWRERGETMTDVHLEVRYQSELAWL